jgi:hypothetical protein
VSLLSYLLRSAEVRLDYIVDGTNLTGTTCTTILFIALSLDINHSNGEEMGLLTIVFPLHVLHIV